MDIGYAGHQLNKIQNIGKKMFYLRFKETEFRFNHRHKAVSGADR